MSADNGIYILQTEGPEFRVMHCQGIDNLSWDNVNSCDTEEEDVLIVNARDMFKGAPVFSEEDKAILFAHKESQEYMILEYGVQSITIARKF